MKLHILRVLDKILHKTLPRSSPFPLWRYRVCLALFKEADKRGQVDWR